MSVDLTNAIGTIGGMIGILAAIYGYAQKGRVDALEAWKSEAEGWKTRATTLDAENKELKDKLKDLTKKVEELTNMVMLHVVPKPLQELFDRQQRFLEKFDQSFERMDSTLDEVKRLVKSETGRLDDYHSAWDSHHHPQQEPHGEMAE